MDLYTLSAVFNVLDVLGNRNKANNYDLMMDSCESVVDDRIL